MTTAYHPMTNQLVPYQPVDNELDCRDQHLIPSNAKPANGTESIIVKIHKSAKLYSTNKLAASSTCYQRLAWNCKKQWRKPLLSFLYVSFAMCVSAICVVIVHERVPDPSKYPPLPDLILDNIPCWPWALIAAEWTITIMNLILVSVIFFHDRRCTILQRLFIIVGTTYLLRCATMVFTSPSAAPQCSDPACGPFILTSRSERIVRAFKILMGSGMSIHSIYTCGDYIFSGHTAMLTILCLFIIEYTPATWRLVHLCCVIINGAGIYFVLAHHGHYSVDVILGFVISVHLFRTYHTIVNSSSFQLDQASHRLRSWFPLLTYFEQDNPHPVVVNTYDWPFKSPCLDNPRNRGSGKEDDDRDDSWKKRYTSTDTLPV